MANKNTQGWTIRGNKIYVQGSIDGVFKRYSTGLEETKKNVSWIKKHHYSQLLQLHKEKSIPKVSNNFVEYALENLELNKGRRKEVVAKEYKKIFENKIAPFFKNYDLKDIKRNDIQKWQKSLIDSGLAGKTVNGIRGIFRFILEEAKKDELIDKNYFDLVDAEKTTKVEVQPFNLDEVKLILSKATGWQKNFFQIAFFTGMRTGEILALKWEDINFASNTISIKRSVRKGIVGTPKTSSSIRSIDMLPLVRDALMIQKKDTYLRQSFVFLNTKGNNHSGSNHLRDGVWKNTLKLCELDYRTLYQTRHTFASLMISKGEDIVWVSRTLGHADVSMTLSKYTKYIKDDKVKRATFLDDFNLGEKTAQKTAHLKFDQKIGA